MVLEVLRLDRTPTRAPVVVNALWMQQQYALFIRGLLSGVLLDLQRLVDRMLMKSSAIPWEGV
jgi:hypothetical protein